MNTSQTTTVLKWLANLSCALEDHQAFSEADDTDLANISRGHAATAISGIRGALDVIERSLDLVGGSPAGRPGRDGSGLNDSNLTPLRDASRDREAA